MTPPVEVEVGVKVTQEVTLTTPIPATDAQTHAFERALEKAVDDGHRIKSATLLTRELGNQRDPNPETYGLKLVLTR